MILCFVAAFHDSLSPTDIYWNILREKMQPCSFQLNALKVSIFSSHCTIFALIYLSLLVPYLLHTTIDFQTQFNTCGANGISCLFLFSFLKYT